jgi:hypothetical protein
MRSFLLPLLVLSVGACAFGNSPVTRLSGAETRSETDSPRIVTAGFVNGVDGTVMELVVADGSALTGTLRLQQQPVIVPLAATGTPLVGGGSEMVGVIEGGGIRMTCRFRLLNAVRGLDGGGSGRCEGSGRRVDFLL